MVADILDNWPVPASKFLRVADRSTRVLLKTHAPFFVLVARRKERKRRKGEERENGEGKNTVRNGADA